MAVLLVIFFRISFFIGVSSIFGCIPIEVALIIISTFFWFFNSDNGAALHLSSFARAFAFSAVLLMIVRVPPFSTMPKAIALAAPPAPSISAFLPLSFVFDSIDFIAPVKSVLYPMSLSCFFITVFTDFIFFAMGSR